MYFILFDMASGIYINSYTYEAGHIQVLFIISPNWKKLNCLFTVGQIHNLWYIPTVEYYTAMKMNELQLHLSTQGNH